MLELASQDKHISDDNKRIEAMTTMTEEEISFITLATDTIGIIDTEAI